MYSSSNAEAGSKRAVELLSKIDQNNSVVGILATEGTCASEAYPATVLNLAKKIIPQKEVKVVQQAGIGLAGAIDGDINYLDPLATEPREADVYFGPGLDYPDYQIDIELWEEYNFESGGGLLVEMDATGKIILIQINSVQNYIKYMLTHLVEKVLIENPEGSLDAVILGCTHYPYVEYDIKDHLDYLMNLDEKYNRIIPEDIFFIDPARSLAIELYLDLNQTNLLAENQNRKSKFFISVPNPHLDENQIDEDGEFPYSWKYGREINSDLLFVKRVPFSEEWIDREVLDRIQEDLPKTFDVIGLSIEN